MKDRNFLFSRCSEFPLWAMNLPASTRRKYISGVLALSIACPPFEKTGSPVKICDVLGAKKGLKGLTRT
jgi:hypothetical protein